MPKDPESRAILARLRAREEAAKAVLAAPFDADAEAAALASLFEGESETACRNACEAERPGLGRFESMKKRWRNLADPGARVAGLEKKLGMTEVRPTYVVARLAAGADEAVALLIALFENLEAEDLERDLAALATSLAACRGRGIPGSGAPVPGEWVFKEGPPTAYVPPHEARRPPADEADPSS